MKSMKNDETGRKRIQECRQLLSVYNTQKNCIEQINEREADYCISDLTRTKQLLEQNVRIVDQMLASLEKSYGPDAAEIVRIVYIEKCKQETAARSYGYSLRTLQRKCHVWMNAMVEAGYER